jgi:hypothetical protein
VLTIILLVLLAGVLVAAGYGLGCYRLRQDYARLTELRQLVHGELVALQQVRYLTEAYFDARDALRRSTA